MAINLHRDIKPISYIKTNAADMMRYVNDVKNPIVITQNGEAKAVLLDVETFQNMEDAFNLLKILQKSEENIKENIFRSAQDAFMELDKKFGF